MQVDFIADPEAAGRYQVIDLESGEEIEGVTWADDDTGRHNVFLTRGRMLADAADADLRIPDKNGGFMVKTCQGEIEIVDLADNALKAALLALLDDPDVVKAIRRATQPFQLGSGPVEYTIEEGSAYEYGKGTWSR